VAAQETGYIKFLIGQDPIALEWLRVYSRKMKTNIITFLSRLASVRVVRQFTPVFAFCGALGLLVGCVSEPESHMVSALPPPAPTRSVTTTTTTTTPDTMPAVVGTPANAIIATATPGVSTTIVTEAPPALQPEVVLEQPSPNYVWIAGYWSWRDGYEWTAGRWELPPNSRSVWVAPRWEQQGNAYKFYEGYWD
jgi:hypothetical protein